MNNAPDSTGQKIELVERFLAAFDRRWPSEEELAELVAPDIRFIERPNLINLREVSATAPRCGRTRGRAPAAGLAVVRGPWTTSR